MCFIILVGKGRAAFLLKRCSKFGIRRKKPKEFPLSAENLKAKQEERKEDANIT